MTEQKDSAPATGNAGSPSADDRAARRAASLRENLRKRKAQQRGRQEVASARDRDPGRD